MCGDTFFAYNANDNLTLAKDPLGRMEYRMKYADGQEVRLGDRVELGQDDGGVVVASIDTGESRRSCNRLIHDPIQRGKF